MKKFKADEAEFLLYMGQKIRDCRTSNQLSQKILAEKMSCDKANLSRIETGKTNASLSTLWLIGKALNVPVSHFFE